MGQLLNCSLCFVLLFLWLFAVSEVDRLLFEVFTSTFLVLFVVAVAGVKGLSKGMGSASLSSGVFPFAFLLLYLFVVAGVDRLPSLGTTLDDGAKVT